MRDNKFNLNKISNIVSYTLFTAAVAMPFSSANAAENLPGFAATKDLTASIQAKLDAGKAIFESGDIYTKGLDVNNGQKSFISTLSLTPGYMGARPQLYDTKISGESYLSIGGSDLFNTNIFSATLRLASLTDGSDYLYYAAGTAVDTTLSGTESVNGIMAIEEGGYADRSIINENGWMQISFETGWNEARGRLPKGMYQPSQADNTTVNNGGYLSVYWDGVIKDTIVNAGGVAALNSQSTSIGTLDVYNGGLVRLSSGTRYSNIGYTFDAAKAEHIALHDANSQLTLYRVENTPGDGHRIAINNLLNNGVVTYQNAANTSGYLQAVIKDLSGNGVFNMRVGGMAGDFLNVTNSVNGSFIINVADTGDELNTDSEGYYLIHANGSSSDSFALAHGAVDLGAYQYYLNQDSTNPDDWVLSTTKPAPKPEPKPDEKPGTGDKPSVGDKPQVSGNTYGVIALANTVPSIWDAELTTLRTRMGDMHAKDSHESGAWGKFINSRYKVNNFVAYKQDTNGVVLGGDKSFKRDGADLLIGAMMSYSRSDIDYNRGGDGKVDSYALGLYGTYLWDNGYYIDGVLKSNRFSLKNNVKTVQGTRATGKDTLYGFGASLEAGRHIELGQYFIEPYSQLAMFKGQSSHYRLSNNTQASADGAKSLKAEIGSTVGANFTLQDYAIKPYVRLAVNHEFADKNDVVINHTENFRNDNSGTVVRYGIGVSADLKDQWSVFTELNYAKGYDGHVEMPYSGQIGIRYQF